MIYIIGKVFCSDRIRADAPEGKKGCAQGGFDENRGCYGFALGVGNAERGDNKRGTV
jgi:hypothetical protein